MEDFHNLLTDISINDYYKAKFLFNQIFSNEPKEDIIWMLAVTNYIIKTLPKSVNHLKYEQFLKDLKEIKNEITTNKKYDNLSQPDILIIIADTYIEFYKSQNGPKFIDVIL